MSLLRSAKHCLIAIGMDTQIGARVTVVVIIVPLGVQQFQVVCIGDQ